MKLAIVTTHPIQYNAPWFRLLALQEGIDVKVFYTWEQSQNAAKLDKDFGKVIEWDLPLLEGYNYTFVKNVASQPGSHHFKGIDNPTLNTEIEDWGADAVLVFGWAFKSHLSCLKYFKKKIPVLFRGDSTLLDEKPGLKRIIRRMFLRYVYSFVDYALYVGQNNKRYFVTHGLKEKQLVFVPHAIDNQRFSENSQSYKELAGKWKQELGIEEHDFVVLFAGKFIEKKNPQFIIDLARQIRGDNVKFLLVGNGVLEDKLKSLATDNRIIFAGFQNQSKMPVVYHAASVFILPSLGPNETWGLAINEAMACGKYVIATTKTGGAIDMIKPGNNGLIIEPVDVNDAAEYIRNLASNNNSDETLLDTNREQLKIYSYETLVGAITNLLKSKRDGK